MIGVRSEPVRRESMHKTFRTTGIVLYDETRIHHMHLKISGWVEHAHVTYEGQSVSRGQPLFSLYSPELYATEQEYVLALEAADKIAASGSEAAQGARAIAEAMRQRLVLWDVEAGEIERLERSREAKRNVVFYAPVGGIVHGLNVRHGMYVTPEVELFSFADLSRVWVEADIYESELGLVKTGQSASLTSEAYPGQTLGGRVSYVYPFLDAATRTNRARFEFGNPGLRLKPQMFVNVTMDIPLGELLSVPEEAVLRTGERSIVFVEEPEGHFTPREIMPGHSDSKRAAVLSGLREGELVVVSGNFLLDSESRILSAGSPAHEGGHAGHGAPQTGAVPGKTSALGAAPPAYPLRHCVVGGEALGSMGEPFSFEHAGRLVMLCCKGCLKKFNETPALYLKKLDEAAGAKAGAS